MLENELKLIENPITLIALTLFLVHVLRFISQRLGYIKPSEPHTGSCGVLFGGHVLGQFVDIALFVLLTLEVLLDSTTTADDDDSAKEKKTKEEFI